jgi:dipeptidyl aminopeptidase/acylaminoacyl peptidase
VRTFAANFRGGPVSPSQLDLRKASRAALAQFGPGAVISDQEQVIWAGYDNAPAKEPRLAYKFIVSGTGVFDRTASQRQLYIVDVETNKILFQEDQICSADINVTVQGNATTGSAADACLPEAVVNLPYARITAGGVTYYTDVNGAVTVPNASGASSATGPLDRTDRWTLKAKTCSAPRAMASGGTMSPTCRTSRMAARRSRTSPARFCSRNRRWAANCAISRWTRPAIPPWNGMSTRMP